MSRYANIAELFTCAWMLHKPVLDKGIAILQSLGTAEYDENRAVFVRQHGDRTTMTLPERIASVALPGRRMNPYSDDPTTRMMGRLGVHVTPTGVVSVPVHGVLGKRMESFGISERGTSSDMLADTFDVLASMDAARGVVLNIDSPGGSVLGVEGASQALDHLRSKKPVVANIDEIGASGAYYIGSHVHELTAAPTAYVGSIGVYTTRVDATSLYEKAGVKVDVISAGQFKTDGHPATTMTPEERARIQSEVDYFMGMFKSAVARGRNLDADAVDKLADGSVEIGQNAVDRGMIDGVALFKDVVANMEQNVRPSYSLTAA